MCFPFCFPSKAIFLKSKSAKPRTVIFIPITSIAITSYLFGYFKGKNVSDKSQWSSTQRLPLPLWRASCTVTIKHILWWHYFLLYSTLIASIWLFSRNRKYLFFSRAPCPLLRLLLDHTCHRGDHLLCKKSQHEGIIQPGRSREIKGVADSWSVPEKTLFISPQSFIVFILPLPTPDTNQAKCSEFPELFSVEKHKKWMFEPLLNARSQPELFFLTSPCHWGEVTGTVPWCVYK